MSRFNIYAHTFATLLDAWKIRESVETEIDARSMYLRYAEPKAKLPSSQKNEGITEIVTRAIRKKLEGIINIDEKLDLFSDVGYYLKLLHVYIKNTSQLVYFARSCPSFPKKIKELIGFSANLMRYTRDLQEYINEQEGVDGIVAVIRKMLERKFRDENVTCTQDKKESINEKLTDLERYAPMVVGFWDALLKLQKVLDGLQGPPRNENPNNNDDGISI